MRKRTKKEFSKKLIIFVVTFFSLCMVALIVAIFTTDKDVTAMFCALASALDVGVLTYSVKAYFGKKNEEENRLKEVTLEDDTKGDFQ